MSSNDPIHDLPLQAYLHACTELIKSARDRADYIRVGELAVNAVQKISRRFSRSRLEKRQFEELSAQRFTFAREYVSALDYLNPRAGDKLAVFDGVWRLAELDVILVDIVRLGIFALGSWWADVEGRPVVDLTACSILNKQLGRLERLERQLQSYGRTQSPVINELEHARLDLAYRGARLSM